MDFSTDDVEFLLTDFIFIRENAIVFVLLVPKPLPPPFSMGGTHLAFQSKHSTPKCAKTAFFGGGLTNTVSFGIPKSAFKKLRKTSKQRRGCGATGSLRVVAEKVVGTTNSAMGAMEGGKPVIITNAEGQRTTSSMVAWTKNGDRLHRPPRLPSPHLVESHIHQPTLPVAPFLAQPRRSSSLVQSPCSTADPSLAQPCRSAFPRRTPTNPSSSPNLAKPNPTATKLLKYGAHPNLDATVASEGVNPAKYKSSASEVVDEDSCLKLLRSLYTKPEAHHVGSRSLVYIVGHAIAKQPILCWTRGISQSCLSQRGTKAGVGRVKHQPLELVACSVKLHLGTRYDKTVFYVYNG
ncbi:hypothetical protein RJ640_002881 [Escallonia rubra]|uniref:Uncharacterized protein n=1 Tax=Escallonia rubra TaxID=112253 RepID=A0AA88RG22_9ASTE|nr:hypothetical protein RJ640_002881 [Escallonia rubra]